MTRQDSTNSDETYHQPDDAMAMLTADHRQVRVLFQQYEDASDPYLKQSIAEHVFAEPELHTLLEETVFYPAFAEQADEEGKWLVKAIWPIGRGQEHTNTANGFAVQHAMGSPRSGRGP